MARSMASIPPSMLDALLVKAMVPQDLPLWRPEAHNHLALHSAQSQVHQEKNSKQWHNRMGHVRSFNRGK